MRQLIFIAFLLFSFTASGQYLTDNYVALDLSFGPRGFSTSQGDYSLAFDTNIKSYSFEKTLTDQHDFFGFNIGLSFGKYKGLNHQIFFDGPFGGEGTGVFGYTIGWGFAFELDKSDILLRPALGISNGGSNIVFGSFAVDSVSQLILGEEFNDTSVAVELDQRSTFFIPELKATFLIAQKWGLFATAAYDVRISNKKQNFNFRGGDSSKSVEINDPFLSYMRTDFIPAIAVDDDIFEPGGLRLSFGIAFYFNKDLYD